MLWKRLKLALKPNRLPSTITSITVLVAASYFMILGIQGNLDATSSTNAILAILTFIAFSEVLERMSNLSAMEEDLNLIKERLGVSKSNLIQAKEFTTFEEFVSGGTDILMFGLTKIGVFVQRINYITSLIDAGCTIRVVILDPKEKNLIKLVSRNLEIDEKRLQTDIEQTISTLTQLRRNLNLETNSRLLVRVFSGAPSVGILIVDGGKKSGRLQVYSYVYKTDPSYRPGTEIIKENDPVWYDYYLGRYENLWAELLSNSYDPTLKTKVE